MILLAAAVTHNLFAQPISDSDVKAYTDCVAAATQDDGAPAKVISVCLSPAKAGIPGAQYALGVSLVGRNEAGDYTAGVDWLEKSAAAGNPAAAFVLASILLKQDAPASVARGRDFLKMSVCAGYPYALQALGQGGVSRDKVGCPPVPEEDFSGEWIADLKWLKTGVASPETPTYQLKITVAGDAARVFTKLDTEWKEVKPGRFRIETHKQSATVTAVDLGFDFDGEWIESWTIQLLRLGVDEAHVAYLRTVNNPHMPRGFSWRAFSSFSEGTARKTKSQ
ncbi:MAG: hypothetical protein M3P06_13090 [Acidobacteriota bacterium]|nr:hypothetical protein [Acidobacteriota bacterium]